MTFEPFRLRRFPKPIVVSISTSPKYQLLVHRIAHTHLDKGDLRDCNSGE